MKKALLSAMVLLVAGSFMANAASKIVVDSLYSNILKATVKFNVYLPNGFDKTDKTYPSVYLLHGLYGTYKDWDENGGMKLVADELISSGEAAEMVIIMPNAGGADVHKIQNGYFNVKNWSYEDFFFKELVPAVEKKYRCIGDKSHRAIMGLSMGGGGSTAYAQKHPDMFSSCYAMSAWLDTRVDESQKSDDKFYLTCEGVMKNSTIKFVENADAATVEKLKSVRWFFDCGDDDGLVYLSVEIHKNHQLKGINSEFRVHNGVHNWEYWHLCLRDALPFATRNFSK